MPTRLTIVALAFIAALVLSIAPALAHAGLIATDPPDGTRLDTAPAAVTFTFTETVAPIRFSLVGSDGQPQTLDNVVQDGVTVTAPLPAGLGTGSYLLSWHVTSADGHPVGGALAFAVGNAELPSVAPAGSTTPLAPAIWVVRWGQYLALFFGLGSLAFTRLVGLDAAPRRLPRLLVVVGLALVPVAMALQGLDLAGLGLDGLLSGTPWSAAFGSSYAATQILFAVAFGLALLPFGWSLVPALIAGIAAPLLSGHASTADPQLLMRPAIGLHMAALLLWLGALWPLIVALRRDGLTALARFSALIPWGIAALLLSGLTLAIVQMGPPGSSWTSPYGLLLGCKLALVATLLVFALWNRVELTRRAQAGVTTPLRRSIATEIGLAVLVLALVSGWRFTTPPRVLEAIEAANAPVSVALTGPLPGTLQVAPGRAGLVTADLTLDRPAMAVTLFLANPGHDIAALKREAVAGDATHWQVEGLSLPVGGDWQVTAKVRLSQFDLATLTGQLSLPDPAKDSAMRKTTLAAASAALLSSAPALAQGGAITANCPTGQTFTAGAITVSGAFTRATAPGAQSAGGYFTIVNSGSDADTLVGVTTAAAQMAGLHQMKMNGAVMEMGEVKDGVAVPAGGSVIFEPMGYHVMMMGLSQQLHQGECVALTLHFAKAGDVAVELNVGGIAQQTPPDTGVDASSEMMDMSHDDMSGMSM